MNAAGHRRNDISGYQALANAVVEMAAKDYVRALRKLKVNPENIPAGRMKDDNERFFRSDWFCELTDMDGIWLMETLRRECGYSDS